MNDDIKEAAERVMRAASAATANADRVREVRQ